MSLAQCFEVSRESLIQLQRNVRAGVVLLRRTRSVGGQFEQRRGQPGRVSSIEPALVAHRPLTNVAAKRHNRHTE